MEINPRLWGSLALAIDAGVDFPLGLWHLACGTEPPPQPHYRTGFYTRDVNMDFDWLVSNLRADHGDKLLLTKSRLFAIVELLRPLAGRESWDHFDRHDLRVLKRILGSLFKDEYQRIRGYLKRKPVRHAEVQPELDASSSKDESNTPGAYHLH